MADSFNEALGEIGEVWLSIGLPVSKRDEKIELIRSSILGHLGRIVEGEKRILSECLTYRESKVRQVNNLLRDLGMDSFSLPSDASLLAQNRLLQVKCQELEALSKERAEQAESIGRKLVSVSRQLGEEDPPVPLFATSIPSEAELIGLRSKLMEREKILHTRKVEFDSLKDLIDRLCHDLDYEPRCEQERALIGSTRAHFALSDANMTALFDLHRHLVQQYSREEARVESLRARLGQLYERLCVPQSERDSFLARLAGKCSAKARLLECEIGHYEQVKGRNMRQFIESVRADLVALFEPCRVTHFDHSLLDSQDYSEHLLVRLEAQLAGLKRFALVFEPVFLKLAEWQECLRRIKDLEKRSTDPNRFNNRGGALLQNERDRKVLGKKLPRLEKEIRSLVSFAEAKEKIRFDSYGLEMGRLFEGHSLSLNSSKEESSKSLWKRSRQTSKTRAGLDSEQEFQVSWPRACLSLTLAPLPQNHFERGELLHSTLVGGKPKPTSSSRLQPRMARSPSTLSQLQSRRRLNRRMSRSFGDLRQLESLPGDPPKPGKGRPPFWREGRK